MSGDFERVLAEAGEAPPGPRPDGWERWASLASMLEGVASLRAEAAARHAAGAGRRREALALYQRTRAAAGIGPGPVPLWMEGPSFDFYGYPGGLP